jgi:hypothetical protein
MLLPVKRVTNYDSAVMDRGQVGTLIDKLRELIHEKKQDDEFILGVRKNKQGIIIDHHTD